MQNTSTQLTLREIQEAIAPKENPLHAEKMPAHHVKAKLSKDVHSILKTCLHEFEDEQREIEDKSFNVDAVIAGRSVQPRMIHELRNEAVSKARTARTESRNQYIQPLTLASRGSFIPSSHFSGLFAF
jgi:hypothetical protein